MPQLEQTKEDRLEFEGGGARPWQASIAKRLFSLLAKCPAVLLLPILGLLSVVVALLFCRREISISSAQYNFAFRSKEISRSSGPWQKLVRWCQGFLMALRTFYHLGQGVGEILLWRKLVEKNRSLYRYSTEPDSDLPPDSVQMGPCLIEGVSLVDQMIKSPTGYVGLGGHFGNFELLAAFMASYGVKVFAVGRAPNYPWAGWLLNDLRKSYGIDVFWREQSHVARRILSQIRAGKVVASIIDQDTLLPSAFYPFFGLEAAYPIGPLQIAIKARVPVFSSFILRTSFMKYKIVMEKIDYNPDDPQAINLMIRVFTERLEKYIRQYPEQWLWWHRRWRRRPNIDYTSSEHRLRSTTEYIDWLKGLTFDPALLAEQKQAEI